MDNMKKIGKMVNTAVVLLKEFKNILQSSNIINLKTNRYMTTNESNGIIKLIDKSIKELS